MSETSAKKSFLYFTNIVIKKWGERNARNNFSRNTSNSANIKCREKNRWKKCENRFLYSHEYRDQKMEGQKFAKQFFQKHV